MPNLELKSARWAWRHPLCSASLCHAFGCCQKQARLAACDGCYRETRANLGRSTQLHSFAHAASSKSGLMRCSRLVQLLPWNAAATAARGAGSRSGGRRIYRRGAWGRCPRSLPCQACPAVRPGGQAGSVRGKANFPRVCCLALTSNPLEALYWSWENSYIKRFDRILNLYKLLQHERSYRVMC